MPQHFPAVVAAETGVSTQDVDLIRSLEACSLDTFDHADHVRAAWTYLKGLSLHEAAARFIGSLQRFAAHKEAHDLYHETVTWAFLLTIKDRLGRLPADHDWPAFAAAEPRLLINSTGFLESLYRPETLRSERARHGFVLPDRAHLEVTRAGAGALS